MSACWSPPCCENKIIGSNLWGFFSSVLSCFPALFPTGHFLSFVSVTLISVSPFFSPLLPLPFHVPWCQHHSTLTRIHSQTPHLPQIIRWQRKEHAKNNHFFHYVLHERLQCRVCFGFICLKEKSSSSINTNFTPFFFFSYSIANMLLWNFTIQWSLLVNCAVT